MSCEASEAGGLPGGDGLLSAGGGLALGRLAATAAALARAPPRRLAARPPDAAAAEAPAPSPTRFLGARFRTSGRFVKAGIGA